jgi:LmbE family N-acetylglucosaminyl deacetylase
MNILALGAHPDDVEFLCAGTLLKYRSLGHKIYIALTTSGNIGSTIHPSREAIAGQREQEQLQAACYYDAEVRFLRFDDEGLHDTPETRRGVINAIRWANPDVILTNPPFDQSTDHAMTGRLVSEVVLSLPATLIPADEPPIDKKPSIFYWDIPGGIGFNPEIWVDISEFMEEKLKAVAEHKSQFQWTADYMPEGSWDFIDYCRTMARFRGIQGGYKYAEGFVGYKILGYVADYRLLP